MVRFGTAGWSYKDWEGIVYPADWKKKGKHPLAYLAACLDAVEINTSFYGHVRPHVAQEWAKIAGDVNPEFRFTAKLHRSFTHSPIAVVESTSSATIRPNEEDSRLAREGLEALAGTGKFGALLIQFPISFKNTEENRAYLDKLIADFRDFSCSVEVRHASWNHPETLAHFERERVSFCNVDMPRLGRALEGTEYVTSAIGYVRLHGRNYDEWFEAEKPHDRYNYLYTMKELQKWQGKIERIAGKAKETYVISNNHYLGKAGVNALELKSLFSHRKVKAPATLMERYPELKEIADPL